MFRAANQINLHFSIKLISYFLTNIFLNRYFKINMHIHLNSNWIFYQCTWNQTERSIYLRFNLTIHLLKFELLSQVLGIFWHDLKHSRHRERVSTISILCRSKLHYTSNSTVLQIATNDIHVFWTWRSTYQFHKPPPPSGTPQNPGLLCTHWSSTEKSTIKSTHQKCHQIHSSLREPVSW